MLDVTRDERDMSSNEKLSKDFIQAMESPTVHRERRLEPDSDEEQGEVASSLLGLFLGSKLYINVFLFPQKHKPYELDFLIR